jgi:hypothetical protein
MGILAARGVGELIAADDVGGLQLGGAVQERRHREWREAGPDAYVVEDADHRAVG